MERAILQIPDHYPNLVVDKFCIMPDHIHMLLFVLSDEQGRQMDGPSVSTVVGMMKRWVSKQLGKSIWQKSFIDRVIRNEKGYLAVWEYIDNNPLKMDCADDNVDIYKM